MNTAKQLYRASTEQLEAAAVRRERGADGVTLMTYTFNDGSSITCRKLSGRVAHNANGWPITIN